jgi:hypothetical protein
VFGFAVLQEEDRLGYTRRPTEVDIGPKDNIFKKESSRLMSLKG